MADKALYGKTNGMEMTKAKCLMKFRLNSIDDGIQNRGRSQTIMMAMKLDI